LRQGLGMFTRRGVRGLKADKARCTYYLEQTHGLAALLNPYLGYHQAAKLAHESLERGISLAELVKEKNLLTEKQIEAIFSLPIKKEKGSGKPG
jgi:aspartate ammonia-lyase